MVSSMECGNLLPQCWSKLQHSKSLLLMGLYRILDTESMDMPGFLVEKTLQMTDNTYIRGASEPENVNRESWKTSIFVAGL